MVCLGIEEQLAHCEGQSATEVAVMMLWMKWWRKMTSPCPLCLRSHLTCQKNGKYNETPLEILVLNMKGLYGYMKVHSHSHILLPILCIFLLVTVLNYFHKSPYKCFISHSLHILFFYYTTSYCAYNFLNISIYSILFVLFTFCIYIKLYSYEYVLLPIL